MPVGQISEENPATGRAPATVMFTDMVGYSELTQRDEAGALRLVNEHRRIVRPLLAEYGGREVKTIGDAFMVEFGEPVAAVRCALAIQRRQAERNRDPSAPEVLIRIGLHAGPVIRQEGDLFGDTVNVASRIEPLAPPGGICLSESVYEVALPALDVVPTPVGPATLKNIQVPVPIYRIDLRPERNVPLHEGPWVDREEELARLRQAFASSSEGTLQIVLLSGQPGVGKTRLAEQLIRAATRQGASVVWAGSSEEGRTTPYALWVTAIEEAARTASPEQLRLAAGEFAAEIQHLVPSVPFPERPEAEESGSDPEKARERLYIGVGRFFRELSRQRPMVLFFDDLQSADPGSLRLLESVASGPTESRLFLLGVYRAEPAGTHSVLQEVVRTLARRSEVLSYALTNLSLGAVRQLVLALAKTKAIPDEYVRQIYERTGGNPYFVEEIIRSLQASGRLTPESGFSVAGSARPLPLPDTVRRLVRQRVERADESLSSFLRTVAVLGPEFSAEPLARLTGLAPDALIDQLAAAVHAGFLSERSNDRGTAEYAFSDRLLWETVYADSPAARRHRDHLRAGDALEALEQSGRAVPAAEIAHHFQQGQAPDRALPYTIRAAEDAGRLFAREDAVRHYRAALLLLDARPDERTRARVLEALGDHLVRLGELDAGQASRSEAVSIYERLGAVKEAGNLHRKIAHAMREDPASARFHWEEARRMLEAVPESRELARLYTTIAGYRYEEGEMAEAKELFGRAVEVARRVDDPLTQVSAELVLAGLRPVGQSTQLFFDLHEALDLADEQHLDDLVPNLYMVLALAHLHVRGDGPESERALDEALKAARHAQDVHSERTVDGNLVVYVAWRRGEYERALRTVEAHLRYAGGDPRKLLPTALLVGADIALTRGEPERADHELEEVAALLEGGGDWSERVHLRNVRGRAELLRGRVARARATLREAHDLAVRAGTPALMAALHAETLHLELEATLQEGGMDPAERFLTALEDLDRGDPQPPVRAYATRARGLLLGARDADPAGAIAALEEANALWSQVGWRYEHARSQAWLAEMYRRSGTIGQAEELDRSAQSFLDRVHGTKLGTRLAPGPR